MTVDQTTLTLLPVVSAAGECLAVYIVVRKVMKEEERKSDAPTTIHVVGDEPLIGASLAGVSIRGGTSMLSLPLATLTRTFIWRS